MRDMRRHIPWGHRSPRPVQALAVAAAALVLLVLAHWVWASVVDVYFSSIVILPSLGTGQRPDFAGMFFHALKLATMLSLLVTALVAAAGFLAWRLWHEHRRRPGSW